MYYILFYMYKHKSNALFYFKVHILILNPCISMGHGPWQHRALNWVMVPDNTGLYVGLIGWCDIHCKFLSTFRVCVLPNEPVCIICMLHMGILWWIWCVDLWNWVLLVCCLDLSWWHCRCHKHTWTTIWLISVMWEWWRIQSVPCRYLHWQRREVNSWLHPIIVYRISYWSRWCSWLKWFPEAWLVFSLGILQTLVKLVQVESLELITCSATGTAMMVKRALTSNETKVSSRVIERCLIFWMKPVLSLTKDDVLPQ